MADGIIGSVGVGVVPDASSFWRDFEAKTAGGAVRAGERDGKEWRAGFDRATGRTTATVKVKADTTKARAEIAALSNDTSKSMKGSQQQANLLRDAIVALGPAAIPVGAVMAGAFAGAIPAAVTLALGIKGIADEMKSGALVGTKYGRDIASLQGEFGKLKSIAAAGLLSGLDRAMQQSGPLFRTLNGDIRGFAAQLGGIVGHVAPALVSILHDLNPLFVTFGSELAKGARTLEHFATSGTGLQSFVAYVQAELPTVERTLGQLIQLVVHLGEGLAPLGHVALSTLGVLASALNALPVDVLSKLETTAVAAYGAFRTYGLISGIVRSVTGAVESMSARQAASVAATQAALLGQQATAAETAAGFAASEAAKALAAAEAAVEIAAALEGTGSVLAAQASSAAEDAIVFAAAMQAEADAAALSATEIAASATAAADAVAASGEAASIGWAGLLGPIGAVVVGVGILGAAMLNSGGDAKTAAADQNTYADSVNKTTDALGAANIAQTNKNLSDKHALETLDTLHTAGAALGVTYKDLALAVNGPIGSFDKLKTSLEAVAQAHSTLERFAGGKGGATGTLTRVYDATGLSAQHLLGVVTDLRGGLMRQIKVQQDLNALERATSTLEDGGTAAARRHAAALGLGTTAYLDAETAARKAAASARANTAAMQAENDAAGLLKGALDRLNGVTLDISDARIAAAQGLATLNQGLHKNAAAWKLSTDAGRTNQQNLNAQIRGIQAVGEAISGGTKLTIAGKRAILDQLGALKQDLIAHHAAAGAIQRVSDEMRRLAGIKIPPTKLDVDKTQVDSKVASIRHEIAAIRQGKVPGIDADTRKGKETIAALQAQIDYLRQKQKPGVDVLSQSALDHIATVQYRLDHLHDKTVTLTTNNVVTQRTIFTSTGKVTATAAGSRAVYGRPDGTVPPNTVSTVGEAGYEALVTDAAGRAMVLSNAQAQAAGITPGGSFPGFAGGSLGGFSRGQRHNAEIIAQVGRSMGMSARDIAIGIMTSITEASLRNLHYGDRDSLGLFQQRASWGSVAQRENPMWAAGAFFRALRHEGGRGGLSPWMAAQGVQSSAFANGSNYRPNWSAALALAGGSAGGVSVGDITTGKVKGKKVWYFDGHAYSTYTAALNAQVSATKTATKNLKAQLHSLAVAGGADMSALARSVTGTGQDVQAAFKQLFGDLRSGGIAGGALDRLRSLDGRLAGEVQQRHRIVTQLAAVQQRQKQFAGSVSSAVVGGFDVTSAGVNAQGVVTSGSLFAQAKQDETREKRVARDLLKLSRRGLNRTDLMALAGQGASALPQMEALLGMNNGQFTAYDRTEQRVAALGGQLGGQLGGRLFGGQIHDLRGEARQTEQEINRTAAKIGEAVGHAIHGSKWRVDERGFLHLIRVVERQADRVGGIRGGKK